MRTMAVTLMLVLVQAAPALAKDFYVDPVKGSKSGDGSAAKPWRTIQDVITANLVETQNWASLPYKAGAALVAKNKGAPIKAGDTIYLRSGYHGELSITGHYNAKVITIVAQAGHTPKLGTVLVRSSSNWVLRALHVSLAFAPTYAKKTLVTVESHSWSGPVEKVTVDSCSLSSVADTSKWTASDWNNKAGNGIQAGGTKITLRKNKIKNVNFGISVGATYSTVDRNTVENFAGDGLRGLGDYTVFSNNTVKNCYDVNANHDDGFQSWSRGTDGKVGTGQVKGIVLRGNLIINYTDPKQPFRCTLQGIGCFDGTFVDWVVENNVIITDHWHGITLLGAKNCRVVNNTLLDPNSVKPGPPWIKIDAHKNGTKPSGCTVRNNLAQSYSNSSTGVTADHNITVKTPATYFVDPVKYDLHLLPKCPAIDKGSATLAPKIDIEGTARPQGAGFDVGAYEWHKVVPKPDASVKMDASVSKPDAAAKVDAVAGTDKGGAAGDTSGGDGPAAGDGSGSGADGAGGSGDGGGESRTPDDGCSCRVGAGPSRSAGLALILALALCLFWRRCD